MLYGRVRGCRSQIGGRVRVEQDGDGGVELATRKEMVISVCRMAMQERSISWSKQWSRKRDCHV